MILKNSGYLFLDTRHKYIYYIINMVNGVKKKFAELMSVPYFYIKSKKFRQLEQIYRRCKGNVLPVPPMHRYVFNNKVFLIPPNLPIGRGLYANIFLRKPLKKDLIKAGRKLRLSTNNVTKEQLIERIVNIMRALKIPDPVRLPDVKRKRKIVYITKNNSEHVAKRNLMEELNISIRNNRRMNVPNVNRRMNVPNVNRRMNVPNVNRRMNVPNVNRRMNVPNVNRRMNVPNVNRRMNVPNVNRRMNVPNVNRRMNVPNVNRRMNV